MDGVVQGSTIELENSVIDKNGFLATPSVITAYVFPYGKKPGFPDVDLDTDYVYTTTPTLISTGKYGFSYTAANDAQVGTWYVLWTGTVGGAAWRSLTNFKVESSGNATYNAYQDEGQPTLLNNRIYTLMLDGILSIEEDELEYTEIWFTSRYTPMYSTYENVINRISSLVVDVNKDAINYMIWKASMEADQITLGRTKTNPTYYEFARKQFVEIFVAISLLRSIANNSGNLKSKQLGELRVEYAGISNALDAFINKELKELSLWEEVLNAAGSVSYKASLPISVAQPGINNVDRDALGRTIREGYGSPLASNTKVRVSPRTKFQHAFRNYSDFNQANYNTSTNTSYDWE
jgi:hypothetical protein